MGDQIVETGGKEEVVDPHNVPPFLAGFALREPVPMKKTVTPGPSQTANRGRGRGAVNSKRGGRGESGRPAFTGRAYYRENRTPEYDGFSEFETSKDHETWEFTHDPGELKMKFAYDSNGFGNATGPKYNRAAAIEEIIDALPAHMRKNARELMTEKKFFVNRGGLSAPAPVKAANVVRPNVVQSSESEKASQFLFS